MKMEGYKPHSKKQKFPLGIMLVAAALIIFLGVLFIKFGNTGEDKTPTNTNKGKNAKTNKDGKTGKGNKKNNQGQNPSNPSNPGSDIPDTPSNPDKDSTSLCGQKTGAEFGPKGMTPELYAQIGPSPITIEKLNKSDATKAYNEGVKLFSSNILKSRELLNKAYNSGKLSKTQQDDARKKLETLANRTILQVSRYVNPRDKFLERYTFKSGDMLNSLRKDKVITKKGVIARLDLNVPAYNILWKINGLRSSTQFRAGRTYKMIKGPFHLVVYKKQCVADLYIQDLFIKRFKVAVGATNSPTPEGFFCIERKTRGPKSSYTNPDPNGNRRVLYPGDSGYPLGKGGFNMKLEGIHQLGNTISAGEGYAIHGVKSSLQGSIGSASSHGCIRMYDKDISQVYGMLQTFGDVNSPNVTWSRWSTVTIYP